MGVNRFKKDEEDGNNTTPVYKGRSSSSPTAL